MQRRPSAGIIVLFAFSVIIQTVTAASTLNTTSLNSTTAYDPLQQQGNGDALHDFVIRTVVAYFTILLTTLDDCVWLAPLIARDNITTAVLHALVFFTTLVGLAMIICIGTLLLSDRLLALRKSVYLPAIIAAILAWILAIALYMKKRQKRQKKQQEQEILLAKDAQQDGYGTLDEPEGEANNYDEASVTERDDWEDLHSAVELADSQQPTFRPILVATLTTLGFLDEISYFPVVILADVFTATQLVIGTALAAITMVLVVCTCIVPCQACFKKLPLYFVVAIFATIITIEVVLDLLGGDDDDDNSTSNDGRNNSSAFDAAKNDSALLQNMTEAGNATSITNFILYV